MIHNHSFFYVHLLVCAIVVGHINSELRLTFFLHTLYIQVIILLGYIICMCVCGCVNFFFIKDSAGSTGPRILKFGTKID